MPDPTPRPPSPHLPALDVRCPCCSGEAFGSCCAPCLTGEQPAPTAQALMRSRYTAFAVLDADYLLATWHPVTRPACLTLDPARRWLSLQVVEVRAGGPFDDVGTVRFAARFRDRHGRGEHREQSAFVREGRLWLYRDARD